MPNARRAADEPAKEELGGVSDEEDAAIELFLTYDDVVGRLVHGRRRTHPSWLMWFDGRSETSFVERVISIYNERGYVPSETQFYEAQERMRMS